MLNLSLITREMRSVLRVYNLELTLCGAALMRNEASGCIFLRMSLAIHKLLLASASIPWKTMFYCRYWRTGAWWKCDFHNVWTVSWSQNSPLRLISKGKITRLKPPGFFLVDYSKSRIYASKPQTIPAHKDNIQQECKQLSLEVWRKVTANAMKRAQMCPCGSHLTVILFSS